jgi:hypothetical protein
MADAASGLSAAQPRLRLLRPWIAAGVLAHVRDVLYHRSRALEGRDEVTAHPLALWLGLGGWCESSSHDSPAPLPPERCREGRPAA